MKCQIFRDHKEECIDVTFFFQKEGGGKGNVTKNNSKKNVKLSEL